MVTPLTKPSFNWIAVRVRMGALRPSRSPLVEPFVEWAIKRIESHHTKLSAEFGDIYGSWMQDDEVQP